jgi:murein L,D-transpeptidase YafK
MRIILILLLLFNPNNNLQPNNKVVSYDKIFIRVFKYEKELEVWLNNFDQKEYHLFKTYPICKLSGTLGPKRKEGDYQVPEGFYIINDFNPYSKYKKSLGINYPNESDKILSTYKKLGGNIYIHGDCVSVGCVAIGDKYIEELFSICLKTKNTIPVHIYPIRFNNTTSSKTLLYYNYSYDNKNLDSNLKKGFYFFEECKYPPNIVVDSQGNYQLY